VPKQNFGGHFHINQKTPKHMPSSKDLEHAITRLMYNVHKAEVSLNLIFATDPFLEGIKTSNYSELIGFFQDAIFERMVLSVAKLFDLNPRSYSISKALTVLEEGSATWSIKNHEMLNKCLEKAGFTTKASTSGGLDRQFTLEVAGYFRAQLPKKEGKDLLSLALLNVKERRHKRIAHDDRSPLDGAKIASKDDFHLLLEFAKTFIGTIGIGYLDYPIVDGRGNYTPSEEKDLAGHQLQYLLKKAGIPRTASD
jgi:hypothetical protein